MFGVHQTNLKMYNGEFDFNNESPQFLWYGGMEGYHFENIWVHDLQNE